MTLAERRERYRTDPAYRARRIAAAKRYQAQQGPLYRKLSNARKAIHRVRESYEARQAHAERLYAKLQRLIRQRDRLAEQWQQARAAKAA